MYLDTPYAFGWHVDNSRGKVIAFHSGSIEGFESIIIRNLKIQSTVIILTNKDFSDVGKLSNELQKIVENL